MISTDSSLPSTKNLENLLQEQWPLPRSLFPSKPGRCTRTIFGKLEMWRKLVNSWVLICCSWIIRGCCCTWTVSSLLLFRFWFQYYNCFILLITFCLLWFNFTDKFAHPAVISHIQAFVYVHRLNSFREGATTSLVAWCYEEKQSFQALWFHRRHPTWRVYEDGRSDYCCKPDSIGNV